jgi:excisionase family DNA binding protein
MGCKGNLSVYYTYHTQSAIAGKSRVVYDSPLTHVLTTEEPNMSATAADLQSLAREGFATIPAAKEFLSISRSALYGLMNKGQIRYAKVGKSRRIPWAALHRFAEACLVSNDGGKDLRDV